mmetsp:Transcript_22079/g.48008  ORF Transcript_22079/g.48008 Transcript_22079/m.48008 type:complete len:84 (-) Transcript_22079:1408-1659(-)
MKAAVKVVRPDATYDVADARFFSGVADPSVDAVVRKTGRVKTSTKPLAHHCGGQSHSVQERHPASMVVLLEPREPQGDMGHGR